MRLRDFHIEFVGNETPEVEDIDLRINELPKFRVGALRNVVYGWLDSGRVGFMKWNFADELWYNMLYVVFFFSVPVESELSLRLGTPKKQVRMKKWSTVTLLVVIFLFFAYCFASFVLGHRSRIRTGISSECVTRTAVIELLGQEANARGRPFLNEADNSLTIGKSTDGSEKQRIRLMPSDRLGEN